MNTAGQKELWGSTPCPGQGCGCLLLPLCDRQQGTDRDFSTQIPCPLHFETSTGLEAGKETELRDEG